MVHVDGAVERGIEGSDDGVLGTGVGGELANATWREKGLEGSTLVTKRDSH
jgi:hypothetical protein